MPVYLHAIATSVPENEYPQVFIREKMKQIIGQKRDVSAILHRVYSQSGIDQRHSVLPDFHEDRSEGKLFLKEGQLHLTPTTGQRNAVYTTEARKLFSETARNVIERLGIERSEITHIITVSCTGFYAPGPDYTTLIDLGLPLSTPRFHIGFMGCYAVFPALRMAKAICESDPKANVLIVSVELCTLHLQFSEEIDAILGASVFGDGASAAIVSAREPKHGHLLRLDEMFTTLAPEGESDMAWTIGDQGFEMVLTSYVPKILEMRIDAAIALLLEQAGLEKEKVDIWAVHPGGRAIIDKVREGLGAREEQVEVSRNVLQRVGNLSSATILFVLEQLLYERANSEEQSVVAMAFGPGLTIESGAFTLQKRA